MVRSQSDKVDLVPLNANRFLLMMSQLAVAYVLLDAGVLAEAQAAKLPANDPDRTFYQGKQYSALWYALQRAAPGREPGEAGAARRPITDADTRRCVRLRVIHFDEVTSLAQVAPTVWSIAAVVVFPLLFFVAAPYGRFTRAGWGPTMPARWGWVLMESPSVFLFAWLWWQNPGFGDALVTTLGVAWLLHYLQRTFVFPRHARWQPAQRDAHRAAGDLLQRAQRRRQRERPLRAPVTWPSSRG